MGVMVLVVKFEDSPDEVDVVQQIMIFGRSFQSNVAMSRGNGCFRRQRYQYLIY